MSACQEGPGGMPVGTSPWKEAAPCRPWTSRQALRPARPGRCLPLCRAVQWPLAVAKAARSVPVEYACRDHQGGAVRLETCALVGAPVSMYWGTEDNQLGCKLKAAGCLARGGCATVTGVPVRLPA
jgi:hypothetical protein